MKIVLGLALLFLLTQSLWADEPLIVEGGLSPNQKLAIVVTDDQNWSEDFDDQSPKGKCYLFDNVKKKIIGPLEEIDGKGGGYGTTKSNIRAEWEPHNLFVAVSFRCGRRMYDFQLYKIGSKTIGTTAPYLQYRAIPQILPPLKTGPGADKIFSDATTGANPGSHPHWIDSTHLSEMLYGWRPKDFDKGLSGMFNSSGQIEVIYALVDNHWKIEKFKCPPENQ